MINALSDKYHPLQALADIMTLKEHFGQLKVDRYVCMYVCVYNEVYVCKLYVNFSAYKQASSMCKIEYSLLCEGIFS